MVRKIGISISIVVFILTACTPANATQSQLPTNTPEINQVATQEAQITNQILAGLPTEDLLDGIDEISFTPPSIDLAAIGDNLIGAVPDSLTFLEEIIKSQIPGVASVDFTETTSGEDRAMFIPRNNAGKLIWSFVESTNQWGSFAVYHFLDDTGTMDGVVTTGIQYQSIPFSQDAVVVWGPQPIVVKNPITLEDGTYAYGVYFDFSSGSWTILPDLETVDGAALVNGAVYSGVEQATPAPFRAAPMWVWKLTHP